jgi:hypothetical protein
MIIQNNKLRGGSRPRETGHVGGDLITSHISGMSNFSGLRPHHNLIDSSQNNRNA